MLIVTVILGTIPWWLPKIENSGKSIVVEVTASTDLQPFKTDLFQELQILSDGEPIKDPYLSTLKISNEGQEAISTKDFETPLRIFFGNSVTVSKLRIAGTSPPDIDAKVESDNESLRLLPVLLNPGDNISVTVLTSGGKPKISAKARIISVSAVSVIDESVKKKDYLAISLLIPLSLLALIPGIISIHRWQPFDKTQTRIDFRKRTAVLIYMVSFGFAELCAMKILKHWGIEVDLKSIIVINFFLIVIVAPIALKFDRS